MAIAALAARLARIMQAMPSRGQPFQPETAAAQGSRMLSRSRETGKSHRAREIRQFVCQAVSMDKRSHRRRGSLPIADGSWKSQYLGGPRCADPIVARNRSGSTERSHIFAQTIVQRSVAVDTRVGEPYIAGQRQAAAGCAQATTPSARERRGSTRPEPGPSHHVVQLVCSSGPVGPAASGPGAGSEDCPSGRGGRSRRADSSLQRQSEICSAELTHPRTTTEIPSDDSGRRLRIA